MRTVLLACLLSMSVWMPQSARAGDADPDRVLVARYYFEVLGIDAPAFVSGLKYARALSHHLQPQSIFLLDKERFARALPKALTDDVADMFKNTLYHRCFAPLSDRQAAQLVAFIHAGPDPAEPFADHHFEQKLGRCIRDIRWVWPRKDAFAALVALRAYHGEVAAILVQPGMARFPNRVARSNVRAALQ